MALLAAGGLSRGGSTSPPARDPDRYSGTPTGSVNANPGAFQNPTGTYGSPWDQTGNFNTQSTILSTLYNNLYGPGAKNPADLLRALAGAQYDEKRTLNQMDWLKLQKNALPLQRGIDEGRYTTTRDSLQALAGLLGGELSARNRGFDNDYYMNDVDYMRKKDQFDSQTIDAGAYASPGYNRDRQYMAQDLVGGRQKIQVDRDLAQNTYQQNLVNQVFQPGSQNEFGWKQNQLDNAMKGNSLDSDLRDAFLKLLQDKLGTAAAKDAWDQRGTGNLDVNALITTLPPELQAFFSAIYGG